MNSLYRLNKPNSLLKSALLTEMKLKAILSGIMITIICWMTAAYIRPVPTNSYHQSIQVSEVTPNIDTTDTETASLEIDEEQSSASID